MKIFVRLKITFNNEDEPEIEDVLKLLIDRKWSKGDIRPNTQIVEKTGGFILSSGIDKDDPLDQHLSALLLRITKASAQAIKKLSETNTVEVLCAIYADKIPSMYVDASRVDGIARLGANLDIDLYLTSETGPP